MDDGENLLTSEKHGWGSDVMLPDHNALRLIASIGQ